MNFKQFGILLPDNPLCGISTYKDTLNLATGACTRYIKKAVFDGSENWRLAASGLFVLSATLIDYYRVSNVDIAICSHYPTQSNVEYQSQINDGYATFYAREINTYKDFYISDTTMETLTAFKTFLATEYSAGTPVTVWYVLAIPTTETITVPSGLSGIEEGYLIQDGTPTPSNPIYPTANTVEQWFDLNHYIMGTSTDTITTLPVDVYANDTTATVGLKGNMEQTGTPTPQNPIQPSECGDRTANLCDGVNKDYFVVGSSNIAGRLSGNSGLAIPVEANTYYTVSTLETQTRYRVVIVDELPEYDQTVTTLVKVQRDNTSNDISIYSSTGKYLILNATDLTKCMINTGQTALPYEPYGYKIPISSAGQTNNIYLGEVQTTRQIKKLVLTGEENLNYSAESYGYCYTLINSTTFPINNSFCSHFKNSGYTGSSRSTGRESLGNEEFICVRTSTNIYFRYDSVSDVNEFKSYLAQQYAAGTPVCVWYVLATEETGIVNEPIRKIGDYADTVSGITIPTIAGANNFDVLTTLKPSEVTANYHGWHTGAVHERDSGQWD